ncbi:MAG TPA: MutL protein, partial [Firmicutes bacterium]|nr:MutL protein [Bacillota bacterium]
IQDGKDLSKLKRVIGTGGVLINSGDPLVMLEGARQEGTSVLELRPESPNYFLDGEYILAAMGLLAQEHPEVALTVLKNSLSEHELTRRDK